jgi:2-oxoisovalerate dehydrogenase E1 component
MGVHWAMAAEKFFPGQIEIVDLRTLYPLDEAFIFDVVKRHGKCLVLTEDTQLNSFAESLAGRISQQCFRSLDAAVEVIGSLDLPAVPMNIKLEEAMLPNSIKINATLRKLLED